MTNTEAMEYMRTRAARLNRSYNKGTLDRAYVRGVVIGMTDAFVKAGIIEESVALVDEILDIALDERG